jgi:hypothetical protein
MIAALVPAPRAISAPIYRPVPIKGVFEMVPDTERDHVFLSTGPNDEYVLLLDTYGNEIDRVGGLLGPSAMELDGERLYVSLTGSAEIAVLDASTLEILDRLDISPYFPDGSLSKVGDYLYFSHSCDVGSVPSLGSVNLQTRVAVDYSSSGGSFTSCPHHTALPQQDSLVAWSNFDFRRYDVSTGQPLKIAETRADRVQDVIASADEQSIFVLEGNHVTKRATFDLSLLLQAEHMGSELQLDSQGDGLTLFTGGSFVSLSSDLVVRGTLEGATLPDTSGTTTVAMPDGLNRPILANCEQYGYGCVVWTAFDESAVRVGPRHDMFPAGHAGYFAWSRISRRTGFFSAFLQTPDGRIEKISQGPSGAFVGGIDDRYVSYTQYAGHNAEAFLYDIREGTTRPIAGINSNQREWVPSISGEWVLFARTPNNTFERGKIFLYNLHTKELRSLARAGRNATVYADQVNGNWAVWTRCANRCNVFRYNITDRTTSQIPNPRGQQYGASVLADGTMYYDRETKPPAYPYTQDESQDVLMRLPVGGTPSEIVTLKEGVDLDESFVDLQPDGDVRIYFAEWGLDYEGSLTADIRVVRDPP